MRKVTHPESRTAFVFSDKPDMFLSSLVTQHLTHLVDEKVTEHIDPEKLHSRVKNALGKVISKEASADHQTFYGGEAIAIIRGLQRVSEGALLPDEDAALNESEIRNRSRHAAMILDEYHDPDYKEMNDLRVADHHRRLHGLPLTDHVPNASDQPITQLLPEHSRH